MADITMLPTAGQKPWDGDLNQAITNINVALENTVGIPAGGAEDEVLVKASGTDYDAAWSTVTGSGLVPDASTTTKGIVELATTGETTTGTDTVRAVTPAGAAAIVNLAGSANHPHTTEGAARNSLLTKNFWQYSGTAGVNDPDNWVAGDEWISV